MVENLPEEFLECLVVPVEAVLVAVIIVTMEMQELLTLVVEVVVLLGIQSMVILVEMVVLVLLFLDMPLLVENQQQQQAVVFPSIMEKQFTSLQEPEPSQHQHRLIRLVSML